MSLYCSHFSFKIFPDFVSINLPLFTWFHSAGLPQVTDMKASSLDGVVLVRWKAPLEPVSGYMIDWTHNGNQYYWKQSKCTNITLFGRSENRHTIIDGWQMERWLLKKMFNRGVMRSRKIKTWWHISSRWVRSPEAVFRGHTPKKRFTVLAYTVYDNSYLESRTEMTFITS